jgi:hypothetical protein
MEAHVRSAPLLPAAAAAHIRDKAVVGSARLIPLWATLCDLSECCSDPSLALS